MNHIIFIPIYIHLYIYCIILSTVSWSISTTMSWSWSWVVRRHYFTSMKRHHTIIVNLSKLSLILVNYSWTLSIQTRAIIPTSTTMRFSLKFSCRYVIWKRDYSMFRNIWYYEITGENFFTYHTTEWQKGIGQADCNNMVRTTEIASELDSWKRKKYKNRWWLKIRLSHHKIEK